jgi:hypothetical protein
MAFLIEENSMRNPIARLAPKPPGYCPVLSLVMYE